MNSTSTPGRTQGSTLPLLLSPIHRITSRLPTQKRSSLVPPAPPAAKKLRAEDVLRREVLVKQVLSKVPGVTVTMVDGKEQNNTIDISDTDMGEITGQGEVSAGMLLEDRSDGIKEVGEVLEKQNESVSLEERQSSSAIVNEAEKELDPNVKVKQAKKKKMPEVEWKLVARTRRTTKFFSFHEVFGGKAEVETWALARSQQVPCLLGARRPTLVVPGLDYGLGEGEGVMLETEAEKREIHLANMENYALNSFVCDTGYLSEEEMVETPCMNRAVSRLKQKRQVKKVKSKAAMPSLTSPDVLGCLWSVHTKAGWRHDKGLRAWQPVILSKLPLATALSHPVQREEEMMPSGELVSIPQDPVTDEDWAALYRVKYLVKEVVQKAMAEAICSKQMVREGTSSLTPASLIALVMATRGQEVVAREELVKRFVNKYFFKSRYLTVTGQ